MTPPDDALQDLRAASFSAPIEWPEHLQGTLANFTAAQPRAAAAATRQAFTDALARALAMCEKALREAGAAAGSEPVELEDGAEDDVEHDAIVRVGGGEGSDAPEEEEVSGGWDGDEGDEDEDDGMDGHSEDDLVALVEAQLPPDAPLPVRCQAQAAAFVQAIANSCDASITVVLETLRAWILGTDPEAVMEVLQEAASVDVADVDGWPTALRDLRVAALAAAPSADPDAASDAFAHGVEVASDRIVRVLGSAAGTPLSIVPFSPPPAPSESEADDLASITDTVAAIVAAAGLPPDSPIEQRCVVEAAALVQATAMRCDGTVYAEVMLALAAWLRLVPPADAVSQLQAAAEAGEDAAHWPAGIRGLLVTVTNSMDDPDDVGIAAAPLNRAVQLAAGQVGRVMEGRDTAGDDVTASVVVALPARVTPPKPRVAAPAAPAAPAGAPAGIPTNLAPHTPGIRHCSICKATWHDKRYHEGAGKGIRKCGICKATWHDRRFHMGEAGATAASKPKTRKCGICGEAGHNRRTCAKAGTPAAGGAAATAAPAKAAGMRRCGICRGVGHDRRWHSKEEVAAAAVSGGSAAAKAVGARHCGFCGGAGHDRRRHAQNEAPAAAASGGSAPVKAAGIRLCGICRKPGHDRRTCPNKDEPAAVAAAAGRDEGVARRVIHCGICGEAGHNRRTCTKADAPAAAASGGAAPAAAPVKAAGVRLCGICREPGHDRRTCPKK